MAYYSANPPYYASGGPGDPTGRYGAPGSLRAQQQPAGPVEAVAEQFKALQGAAGGLWDQVGAWWSGLAPQSFCNAGAKRVAEEEAADRKKVRRTRSKRKKGPRDARGDAGG